MKKNKLANGVMVTVILLMVASGVLTAMKLRGGEETGFGSAYRIARLPDDRLTFSEDPKNICTITIRCDTALESPKLEQAKGPYLPADGLILPVTTVEFTDGETVFDVLSRVCEAAELQIEYSWTPLYDNYYIEGICHLYEFDCGPESGWMYTVNGEFPNYGCSSYELAGGEEILWCYTCDGLGTDVGAERDGMK